MSELSRSAKLRGVLRCNEPMAGYCSWRVGGRAERCFEPLDRDDLIKYLLSAAPGEALTFIGLGSNVLIRDGGLPGTVILTGRALSKIASGDGISIRAEAGVPCAKVARVAAQAGFTGGEFLAGIPGTLGGALAMNAGAFGAEIWPLVVAVETVDRRGQVRIRPAADFGFGYRAVDIPLGEWFLSGTLQFAAAGRDVAVARVKEFLARRSSSQPTGAPSCGSVFKNPPGDFAGRLIEAAELKGYRHGGCFVSDKHANFIINTGDASATDIEDLILIVREIVARKFGVMLEPEVRILGRREAPRRVVDGVE